MLAGIVLPISLPGNSKSRSAALDTVVPFTASPARPPQPPSHQLITRSYTATLNSTVATYGPLNSTFAVPVTATAAQVPSIGTEFSPPAPAPVADGVLPRWRQLVEQIKSNVNYTKAIGEDLGIGTNEHCHYRLEPHPRLRAA